MTGLGWRVIKFGGSLLDWPESPLQLRRWMAEQPAARNVLIVGGGERVERLRTSNLPAESAHWLAIAAMSCNAETAAQQLGLPLVRSLEELQQSPHTLSILEVERMLRDGPDGGEALPHSWDVTSDSIAAYVATLLRANELVLLKSRLPEGETTTSSAAACGYVDAYFPRAAQSLRVRCVNLRDSRLAEVELRRA
jgi:aspartokinase-like uncharacterized kinase